MPGGSVAYAKNGIWHHAHHSRPPTTTHTNERALEPQVVQDDADLKACRDVLARTRRRAPHLFLDVTRSARRVLQRLAFGSPAPTVVAMSSL